MSKGFSFFNGAQNRRAQCLAMAIQHADTFGCDYDAEDVITNAAAFDNYIVTGNVPSMDDDTDDGVAELVIGFKAGSGTPVDKAAASEKDKTAAGSVSETENEKHEIEEKLAVAQQLGLRLVSVKVIDAKPQAEWQFNGPDNPILRLMVSAAIQDISSKIGKVFDAGFIIRAVHYDDTGFPCVSWSPVSAAA